MYSIFVWRGKCVPLLCLTANVHLSTKIHAILFRYWSRHHWPNHSFKTEELQCNTARVSWQTLLFSMFSILHGNEATFSLYHVFPTTTTGLVYWVRCCPNSPAGCLSSLVHNLSLALLISLAQLCRSHHHQLFCRPPQHSPVSSGTYYHDLILIKYSAIYTLSSK